MPSTGMPSSSSSGSSFGAPSAYTDAGPPDEDQPLGLAPPDLLGADVVGQQLAEDAALAHAARDQLRVLPAVVEDDDLVDRRRAVDGRRLVGELRGRRRGGDEVVRHARAGALSAGAPFAASARARVARASRGRRAARAHAHALRALQLLALGLQRRGDHQLGPVELGDVLVAARRHRGAQAAHEVERAVVLAGGPDEDLLERAVLRPSRRARRAAASGGTSPCPSGSRGRAPRRRAPAASRSSRRRRRRRSPWTTSPPLRMPPSAITWTYSPVSSMCCERAAATSAIAVACGTPMPSTPRVVHAAPGPTPTSTPAAPVRIRCRPVW